MAQQRRIEKPSFRQVLSLAEKLPAKEQQHLSDELTKLQELRAALEVGVRELEQGKGVPGEQVFQELRVRHAKLAKKQNPKCAN